ncbi:MAG: hypothetical protein II126_04130 [Erysipelotrichaceae bacterium]|nr:hypothetical protein [Erysipelotrichaceae bacterium]
MKKIIKIMLATMIMMLSININTESVSAASVSISGASSVKEGDTITVTVVVKGATVTSGSIDVSCSSSFEIVSGKWALSGTTLASYDSGKKKGAFAFSGAKTLNGNYFTITLKAKKVDKAAKVSVNVQLKNGDASAGGGSTSKTINIICKTHSFSEWNETAATCTKAGSRTRTCSVCGTVETQTIQALGHDVKSYTVTKQPGCTETGTETGKCSRCNQNVSRSIPALGHEFGEWAETTPATCTEHGIETRKCVRCDYFETRESELAPHEYGEEFTVVQEATLTQEGIIEAKCVHCGAPFRQTTGCKYVDEENGVTIECEAGTFQDGTQPSISTLTPSEEEKALRYAEVEKITGSSKIIDVKAVNGGSDQQPSGKIKLTFAVPDSFSNNVAVTRIAEDGKVEMLGCEIQADAEGRRTAVVYADKMGQYCLIDLEAVPAARQGIPSWWKYVAFSEGGIILLLFFLLLAKKKKKEEKTNY